MNAVAPSLDQIAEEFLAELRAGRSPKIEVYLDKNPPIADEVSELLTSIELMEQFSHQEAAVRELANRPIQLPEKPSTLGDFDIVCEIGRGGMGVVYEAIDRTLDRRVALKVLHAVTLSSQKQIDRFRRESQLAAQLHHTNIVSIYGVGDENGTYYYAMQFVDGTTVAEILHQVRNIKATEDWSQGSQATQFLDAVKPDSYWRNVAKIGIQAADALQYAHGNGILHRDIKPANLLFDDNGTIWVADFGLAKLSAVDDLTKTGDVVGTLRYMAPEQLDGKADARTDVYALGLTLYELLTLKPACSAESYRKLFAQKRNQSFASPRTINAEIPSDLETIVQKSLAPDPDQRYQSAEALSDDLQRFLRDRPILARRVSPLEHAWRWCRRNRAIASLLAVSASLLVLLPIVLGWAYARESVQRQKTQRTLDVALHGFDELYRSFLDDEQPLLELTDGESVTENLAPATLTKDTARILERMLAVYDQLAQESDEGEDQKLSIESARARRRVGDLYQRLGQFEKAMEAHRDAIQRFKNLSSDNAIEISRIQNAIGSLHMQQQKFREAHASHFDALDTLNWSHLSGPEVDFELARTQYLLGKNEEPFGRRPSRRGGSPRPQGRDRRRHEHLAQAIGYLEQSAAKVTPSRRLLLALCLRETASYDPFDVDGTSPRARSARLLHALVDEFPDVPKYRFELSETYRTLRRGRMDQSDAERSIEQLHVAQNLSEQLVSEQNQVAVYRINLAHIYARLGEIYADVGNAKLAETHTRQSIASHRQVIRDFPGLAKLSQRLSGSTKTRLAESLFEQLRWEEGIFVIRPIAELLRTRLEGEEWHRTDLLEDFRETVQQLVDGYERLGNQKMSAEIRSWLPAEDFRSPFTLGLDKNHDKSISYDELELAPQVLTEFDNDGNGMLSINELREMIPPPPNRGAPPNGPLRRLQTPDSFVQSIFSYDNNSDRVVTRDELSKQMARGWFRRADMDRNGEVAEYELRTMWDRYSIR